MDEEALFLAALSTSPEDRPALFDRECHSRPAVRARVERLLALHDRAHGIDVPLEIRTNCFARDTSDAVDGRPEPTIAYSPRKEDSHESGGRIATIGEYEVLEEIARGGMGVVYRALHRRLNRVVAIKLIRAGALADADEILRFQAEAESAARLDHPGIVPVFEAGEHRGQPFIAMAYVDGPSLWSLARERPLESELAARIIAEIAQAMHYAHGKGIVHRDLKPQNILIASDGRAKVTDFGLAKRSDVDRGLTLTGMIVGTPGYMPPEQAQGRQDRIGPLSDVYSLGATLYAVLAGRPPFQAATLAATIREIVESEPVAPRTLNPSVPRDLETICLKALQKVPEQRYASAAEFAADLDRFRRGEPIAARPVGRIERAWRWSRRNPALASAILGIAATLSLGTVVSSLLAWRAIVAEGQRKLEAEVAIGERNVANDKRREAQQNLYFAQISLEGMRVRNREAAVAQRALRAIPRENRGFEHRMLTRLAQGTPLILRSRGGRLDRVAFAPDGNTVVAAADDGTVTIWDANTGREQVSIPTAPGIVSLATVGERFFALSSDGRVWVGNLRDGSLVAVLGNSSEKLTAITTMPDGGLLTGAKDGRIAMWNVETQVRQAVAGVGDVEISALVLSPDQTRVFAGDAKGTVRIINLVEGTEVARQQAHDAPVRSIALRPDGREFATFAQIDQPWRNSENRVRTWNATTGEPVRNLGPFDYAIYCVAYGPDGRNLAAGSIDGVHLWNAAHDSPTILRDVTNILSLSFFPDGSRLVARAGDYQIALWDLRTQRLVSTFLGHESYLTDLAVAPDGERVATVADDGTLRFWNARGFVGQMQKDIAEVRAVAWSSWDNLVAGNSSEFAFGQNRYFVRLWDARTGALRRTLSGHDDDVEAVAFSPNGSTLASASRDKSIRIWDCGTGEAQKTLRGHENVVQSLAFRPDGEILASGSWDGSVRLWNPQTGESIAKFERLGERIIGLAWSPDGARIAYGGSGIDVKILDAATGATLQTLSGHQHPVTTLAFSGDGTWLASGSYDGIARIWDGQEGREIAVLRGHSKGVYSLAFTPDGRGLATGSADASIKFWHVPSGTELISLVGHPLGVKSLAFAPGGDRLFSGASSPGATYTTARVWDSRLTENQFALRGHTRRVMSASFAPNGLRLATGSIDRSVRLWDTRDWTAAGRSPSLFHEVWQVGYSRDGQFLVVSDREGRRSVLHAATAEPVGADISFDAEFFASVKSQNSFDAWTVFRDGENALVVERTPAAAELWEEDCDRREYWLPIWYSNEAHAAEEAGDWFSAVWNLRRLVAMRPSRERLGVLQFADDAAFHVNCEWRLQRAEVELRRRDEQSPLSP